MAEKHHRQQSGFTLIEVLISVFIISFLTVTVLNSYNSSQERILFHEEVLKISSLINNVRSLSLTELIDSSANYPYVVNFSLSDQVITSFLDSTGNPYVRDGEDVILGTLKLDLGDNDILDIDSFRILTDTGWQSPNTVGDLAISFSPPFAECDFVVYGQVDPDEFMIQIPVKRSGEDTATR